MLTALFVVVTMMVSCVSGGEPQQAEAVKPCECEFMSIIVFPQLIANRAFEKNEVLALFDTVQQPLFFLNDGSMGSLVDPHSYAVQDRDMLVDVTLKLMKIKGVHIVFGEKPSAANAQLIGYLGEVHKNDGSIHYVVCDREKKVIYDYHSPKLTKSPKSYIAVWFYTE